MIKESKGVVAIQNYTSVLSFVILLYL